MARVDGDTPRWRYRQSVREHVREPLRAALAHVQREQEEINAERAAFEHFAERVGTISPVGTTGPVASADGPQLHTDDHAGEKRAAVREAYEETVMDLDHYEDVYDEPLLVNVAGELSAEIAEGLRDEADLSYTEHLQSVICAAATDAAERREKFQERLANERDSVEAAREAIRDVTESLDGSGLPQWYRPSFDAHLDELETRRQEHLQSLAAYRRTGHDLCEYVYEDEPWTYPVLTAVARLRHSVE